MLISGRNIVIIGLQPWYTDIGSNCKHIATILATTNQVLYVNIPLNRKLLLFKKKYPELAYHFGVARGTKPALVQINDHFWNFYPPSIHESINWIRSAYAFDKLNFLNNKRLARDIHWAATELGFENYLLFNDNDIFRGYYLKELLHPEMYIYYCRDYLRSVPYFSYHANRIEPLHISKADLALSNSYYLEDYLKQFNPNSFYTGQGCNIELFNGYKTFDPPEDIKHIPHPRIGYVGNLYGLRLDEEIFFSIAKHNPDWQIILIGPEDESFRKSKLHDLANVHFLGKKPLESLPAYIQSIDVCLNPQRVNELTIGNYPLKVDEYLAMGKPVVATRTHAMKMFETYCYLAEKKEDFPILIEQALYENNPLLEEKRKSFASTHTWEHTVSMISEYILLTEKGLSKYQMKAAKNES
ncbi:glycosyltransferase involved in cell wall biosynthesis [Thermoflavifilum aggregans]|uniref:Glycosyltransferase involved in cell wall biosynthesis n=1 Tax=Thermoflavifilum aggregans TaxID=454188 RepID=A0A2M9CXE4_9BACT|nr:glycosyltransferase [Thermoflavifilum aggregans]PJJ76570.1 glycosyltransferase involved in cell wall biosynthesis [Thermoflavifilum aggregans]